MRAIVGAPGAAPRTAATAQCGERCQTSVSPPARQPVAPARETSLWQLEAPSRRYGARPARRSAEVGRRCRCTAPRCAWRLLEHGVSVAVVEGREVAAAPAAGTADSPPPAPPSPTPSWSTAWARIRLRRSNWPRRPRSTRCRSSAGELRVPQAIRRTGSLWLATEDEAGEFPAMVAAAAGAGIRAELAPERIPAALRDSSSRRPTCRRTASCRPRSGCARWSRPPRAGERGCSTARRLLP